MKNWMATSFWARSSAWWERVREPVKRHTITTLANPSIAESMPKPMSAMDPATMPATMPTSPSTAMYARLAHDSHLALLARWR